MKCGKCLNDFEEKNIEESHDVPCYLFPGEKNKRKNEADKLGRKMLCVKCHDTYEAEILQLLFLNLLHKEIPLITNRLNRISYFPKIWRLPESKKKIGIKICLKLNQRKEDDKDT